MVYADGGSEWLDEQSPLMEGAALNGPAIRGEEIALELASDSIRVIVMRFGLFYGGEGNRNTAEMLRMSRRHLSMVPGTSSAFMSAIHVDDAASAVVAALAAPTGVYNVTDDEPLPRGSAIEAFSRAFCTPKLFRVPHWALRWFGGAPAASMTASQRVSNRKFEALTGWAPRYPNQIAGWRAEHERREAAHA